jgi:hypothetical protein
MSELDFPELDTAAPAASTAVAQQPAAVVDLTKLDLQAVALAQFNTSHAAVKTARETLDGVVHDLSTPGKLADAKSPRHRLIGQPLAEARKISAGLKSKLTAVSRAVGAELESVEAAFQKADALISPQIAKREEEMAEERRVAEQKEAARVQAHRDNLAKLAGYVEFARGLPSGRIADGIAKVSAISIEKDAWEDFYEQALKQKADTLASMQKLHDDALADEERARAAAALKAEEERLAAQRAEFERQQAEFRAQQEAAAQAQREREEAERQAQAIAARVAGEAAKAAAPGSVVRKPLPDGVVAGAVVNDSGNWYAADGTFMNPDGSRNIFDDVDESSEIAFAPASAPITTEQGSQQVLKAEAPAPEATDRDAPASTSPSVGSMGAGQPADAGPAGGVATPLHTTYTRTLRLGEIQARLAPLSITAEGLAQLGFPAHVERGLKLYWPGNFPAICRAISDHALALASAPQQLAA